MTVSLRFHPLLMHFISFSLTRFGMDAEGALQQVVDSFTDVHINPRVTVLPHDLLLKVMALGSRLVVESRVVNGSQACAYDITTLLYCVITRLMSVFTVVWAWRLTRLFWTRVLNIHQRFSGFFQSGSTAAAPF